MLVSFYRFLNLHNYHYYTFKQLTQVIVSWLISHHSTTHAVRPLVVRTGFPPRDLREGISSVSTDLSCVLCPVEVGNERTWIGAMNARVRAE